MIVFCFVFNGVIRFIGFGFSIIGFSIMLFFYKLDKIEIVYVVYKKNLNDRNRNLC